MRELWNPWTEAEALRRAVDRAFGAGDWAQGILTPAVQVDENDLGWRLAMDLPGVTPDDLEVEQEGARVRVRAVRRLDGERAIRIERMLSLPETADHGRLEARLEHGVLTLLVPRAERYQPRRLQVAVGGGGGGQRVIQGGEAEGGRAIQEAASRSSADTAEVGS